MGTGFSFKCPYCGHIEDILLGIGMMYSPENVFGSLLPKCKNQYRRTVSGIEKTYSGKKSLLEEIVSPELYKIVLDKAAEGYVPLIDEKIPGRCFSSLAYGYELYYCPKCNHLETHFDFELEKDGDIWQPENYLCEKCGTVLEHGEPQIVVCENCGKIFPYKGNEYFCAKWD